MAYLNEANPALPSIAATIKTTDKNKNFKFRSFIYPIDPRTGLIGAWETVKPLYGANVFVSKFADVEGSFDTDTLKLSWATEAGNKGQCVLPKSKAD